MFPKAYSAVVALAASTLVSAQTFTDCNPLKKTCPADPAFGSNSVNCDFTKGACSAFTSADGTTISYDGKGAKFDIKQESDAPTIKTTNYLFFGRIDVVVQAAAGQGIVTSAVLQSDDLDEIDWEWVGGDNAQVQTNYFSKGDTTTYDRGQYHPVSAPLTSYHKYSVEWTSVKVDWLIDDVVVRTLVKADTKGGDYYPQTPMQVKLGTWVGGGKDSAKGTVEWAGGYTDFSKAPFDAYYKSITIVDYAGKDAAGQNSNVKEYVYGDNSGSWKSIVVKTGDGSSNDKTTTTAQPTSTKTQDSTSKATTTAQPTTTKTQDSTTKTTKTADDKTTATTKTESAKGTTTSTEVRTTFSTAVATTPSGSQTTGSSGSGSGSGSGSQATGSATAAASGTSSGAKESVTTVPTSAAPRLASNFAVAAGALLAAMFLI